MEGGPDGPPRERGLIRDDSRNHRSFRLVGPLGLSFAKARHEFFQALASLDAVAKIQRFEPESDEVLRDRLVKSEVLRVKARIWLAGTLAAMLLVCGCGAPPMAYVLNGDSVKSLKEPDQAKLVSALDESFGTPAAPKLAPALRKVLQQGSDPANWVIKGDDAKLTAGANSYRKLCMHCHGLSGDGNGPTAKFLLPLPRDYRKGLFKFTSTDQSSLPTRDDLLRTLKSGIAGTSMPSFALFDPAEISNVLDYVILLSIRGQTESFVVAEAESGTGEIDAEAVEINARSLVNRWAIADSKVVRAKVPRVSPDAESIERGRKLFLSERAQCTKCHGKKGLGDGLASDPNADPKDTKDSWGNQAKPSNLTLGVFRGGGRPIDVFRRLHSGIKGTPMPAQSTNFQDDKDLWDLVNFVLYLPYHESVLSAQTDTTESKASGT